MKKKSTSLWSGRGIWLALALWVLQTLPPGRLHAQTAGSYTFAQSGGTYTAITGGTVLNTTIPDSWQTASAIPLAPAFYFCGTFYTTMWVTSNGVISLGGTAGPGTTLYNGISSNGSGSGIHLCVFGADQIGSSASGAAPEIRYQFINNEHVIQWKDISRYPASTDRFSYQARLNAITGSITYVYTVNSVGTSTSYQPAIGIRTASTAGNWQSRLVSAAGAETWATSLPAAATGDLLRFTSNTTNPKQPVSGQTYVWNPPTPPPTCTSLTFPTSSSTNVNTTTICISGNVSLSLGATMPSGATGIRYIWQYSTTGAAPWTNMDTTYSPAYTTTAAYLVNSSRYFRCLVQCQGSTVLTSANSQQVVVNSPGNATAVPASRCGPGAITVGATPPAGSTISWYQNATGGSVLATGNNYTIGYLPATATYYAAATSGSSPATQWVGTGTATSTSAFIPYYDYYYGDKVQYLVRASELIAAGLGAGDINSIGFDVTSVTSTFALSSFSIAMKQTTLTALTTSFETGLTPVYSNASYQPVANSVNTHTLTAPFPWDGVSNIIIEVCHNNTGYNLNGPAVSARYTNYSYNASHYNYADDANQCAAPSGTDYTSTSRPNMQFNMTVPCVGPRVPVTATITTPPAVTKTFPAVVCSNEITPISVASSPMSNYTNYTWTPVTTNLYTNAAATTPYMAGSAPTVYMKSDVVGQNVYYLYASGATAAACAFADTVRIWVQPDSVKIAGLPDSICVTGTSTLKLLPESGYAANSIQWQESATGAAGSYNNINGATGLTYTTPVLTANHYYRALIKSTNDTCEMPVKYVVVVNPQILSVADSFNCGPGPVTLRAETGGNSVAKWYTTPSGGTPVGAGNPWTTPYLGATQTYYVSAEGGGGNGDIVVGTGTTANSTTSYPTPFGAYYGSSHDQYLIRASELTAAGAVAGNLSSIAFDLSAGYTYAALQNFTIKMAQTTATALNSSLITTGFVTVRPAASYTPPATSGYAVINFTTPFSWDGVSNVVVDVSFLNCTTCNSTSNCSTGFTNNGTVRQTSTSYVSAHSIYYDNNCTVNTLSPSGSYNNNTYSQRPNMKFLQPPCATPRQAVVAHIYPKPTVDLGQDINECVDAGAVEILDAGVQPNSQFLWDNGSTSQVRAVTQSGTYSVRVTNQYTCYDEDTVVVNLRRNPVVRLGNDTTVCNGVVLPLNAGPDGVDYFWSTGQTSQVINVNTPGSYNVFVTNNAGCVKADTIVVNMAGELPTIQGISVSNNGINTFHFTAVNPQNVIGYEWDFGDNTPHSYQASPSHTYANAGNYIVTLHLSSSCGFDTDSTSAHIVGIHQLNVSNEELTVFPNPARSTATILNKGALKMESVSVYNILGQVVYQQKSDSKEQHVIRLDGLASGVYTIQIFTDKGTVPRKLEIIK